MDTQLKKGLLEICVLAVLKKEDSYGYKIVKDISPYIEISIFIIPTFSRFFKPFMFD